MLGLGLGLLPKLGGSYQAEAVTLFAAMTSQPDATRKGHINTLIAALKTGGIWTKLDLLYVTAAHDAQAAQRNWKTPASYALTPVNSPTFLADRHYVGDGVSMHLTTGFTPSINAVAMTQNSAMIGAWVRNNVNNASMFEIGTAGVSLAFINTRNNTNLSARINSSNNSVAALGVATSVGFSAINRAASGSLTFYKDGASIGTPADVSTGLVPAELTLLRYSTIYSTRQLAAMVAGGSLTAGEHAALHSALSAYMTAVGAA